MRANKDLDNFVELIDKTENDFAYFDDLLRVLISNFGSNSSLITPYFERGLGIINKFKNEINNVKAYECFIKGISYFLEHEFQKANTKFSTAKNLFLEEKHMVLAHFCDTMKGIVFRSLGELDHSIEHLEKGIIDFETDKFPELAIIPLFQLGLAYYRLRDYEQSECFFNESLQKSTKINKKSSMIRSLWGLADLSKRSKNYEKRYSYLEKALNIVEENELGAGLESRALSELAMYFLEEGNYDQARLLERKSLGIKESSGMEDQMITSLMNLGKIYFSEENFLEARVYLEKAREIAERIQVKFKTVVINRYLADIYEKLGMLKEALASFKLHDQMNTELLKEKENLFYKRKNREVKEQKEIVESIHRQLK